MKIGLYSPYWRVLGGGEKYMLDAARCFPDDEIIFVGDNDNLLKDAQNRFGFSKNSAKIITDYKTSEGKLKKEKLKDLDLFFYQCDGSIFFPFAKKNILLVQSPAHSPVGSLKDKIKLMFWQKIICNSKFTANYVKQKTGISPKILNPCIDKIPALKKENIILSVGRFFPHLHSKKQEVLIEVFKKIHQDSYRLILAGSVAESDKEYLNGLKKQAESYDIEIQENISFEKLKELYGKAKIYWHAAGFGEDLSKHPERAEHFGISTIEAISAGCYPLVFKGGGQIEVIGNNPEFYWETKEELLSKTRELIDKYEIVTTNNDNKIKNIPDRYSFKKFKTKLYEIIK